MHSGFRIREWPREYILDSGMEAKTEDGRVKMEEKREAAKI